MKANQKNKKGSKKNNNLVLGVVAVIVIGIAAFTFLNFKDNEGLAELQKPTAISAIDENGDMVILASDITETASFYGYDELDTYIEVLAVKAEGIFANWK